MTEGRGKGVCLLELRKYRKKAGMESEGPHLHSRLTVAYAPPGLGEGIWRA